ncbi:MAG: tetratricopeptide repeat protein [Promethearchaeota archaeon]|nr:MAG: tetratricopeptide repeat protein [Candidatus Lokiarchaeota archaeon]
MDLFCQKCGNRVTLKDVFCKNCGAQVGKFGDEVPFLHFGGKKPTVESVNIRELGDGRIQVGNKIMEPLDISTLPPLEDMKSSVEYTDKGTRFAKSGNYEEALNWYDKALELLPGAWFTLELKTNVFIAMERFEEAEEITRDLLRRNIVNTKILYMHGVSLINTSKPDEGLFFLHSCLRADPNFKPALEVIKHVHATNPNDAEVILPKIKAPIRKTYEMLYDLLKKVNSEEWISIRFLRLTGYGFVESAIEKDLDFEFEQPRFAEMLPRLMYFIMLDEWFFILYVGKLNSNERKTLAFGKYEELFDLFMMYGSGPDEKPLDVFPFYEPIASEYPEIQKQWKAIWENELKFSLYMFYNLHLLIKYLETLKGEI